MTFVMNHYHLQFHIYLKLLQHLCLDKHYSSFSFLSDTFSLELVSSPPQFFLFITFSIIGFSTSSMLAMSLMAFDNFCC